MKRTKIIHHLGRHLEHEVIETQTLLFGRIINRSYQVVQFF